MDFHYFSIEMIRIPINEAQDGYKGLRKIDVAPNGYEDHGYGKIDTTHLTKETEHVEHPLEFIQALWHPSNTNH
jgi:hypothetical protein